MSADRRIADDQIVYHPERRSGKERRVAPYRKLIQHDLDSGRSTALKDMIFDLRDRASLADWRNSVTVAYGSGYGGARFDEVAKGVRELRKNADVAAENERLLTEDRDYLRERACTAEVRLASLADTINQELRENGRDRAQIRDPLHDDMNAAVKVLVDAVKVGISRGVRVQELADALRAMLQEHCSAYCQRGLASALTPIGEGDNMKAIVVKVLPATDTKPTRLKASAEGVPSIIRTANGDWGYEKASAIVARELCDKYGWDSPIASGQLPSGDHVFCFVENGYNVYTK